MQQRTFCVGDVHGCYDELMLLLEKIGLKREDHLYFVGDLINKGPKSLEVIEFVMNRPNTWSVKGNHELFSMIENESIDGFLYLTDKQKSWVRDAIPEYAEHRGDIGIYHEWLESLPLLIEREDFIVVHAGIHPDFGLHTPPELMTLLRTLDDGTPWYTQYMGQKPILYGHWAADGLRIRGNTIGLDTGCCFGGALTAYCIETREVTQVRANHIYTLPKHWKIG